MTDWNKRFAEHKQETDLVEQKRDAEQKREREAYETKLVEAQAHVLKVIMPLFESVLRGALENGFGGAANHIHVETVDGKKRLIGAELTLMAGNPMKGSTQRLAVQYSHGSQWSLITDIGLTHKSRPTDQNGVNQAVLEELIDQMVRALG